MNPIVTVIISILVFGFLIFVHEFGHYIFARIFKVTIYEFSIGMGPRLVTFKSKKTGIRYSIAAIPFGGYVAMAGEDGVYRDKAESASGDAIDAQAADPAPDFGSPDVPKSPCINSADAEPVPECDPNGFDKKPAWQRLIITVAGALVNLLVGFIVLIIFTCISDINGTQVEQNYKIKEEEQYEYINSDELILEGDIITAIDGRGVSMSDELVYEIMRRGHEPVDVALIRDGKEITIPDVSFPRTVVSGQSVGALSFRVAQTEKNFGSVISYSVQKGVLMVRMCWEALYDLLTGRFGFEAVSGPVGVSTAIGEAASTGIDSLLYIIALITINLGVMNLLPIPALDGGRTLTILIEIVTRKKMPPKVEQMINGIGLALLLGLSAIILIKDVFQLII